MKGTSKLPPSLKNFGRALRNGGWPSALGCLRASAIRRLLPRLTDPPMEDFEVHVLTGRERLTMCLWMVASWIAATKRYWRFVIHDDGSLREADANLIRRLLPQSRLHLSTETTLQVSERLKGYPLCLQCRNLHPLARKLFDMPLFATGDRLLAIDTDILFFERPVRLEAWIAEPRPNCIFMEDVRDMTLLTPAAVQQILGLELVKNINTGIVAVPKTALTLELLEGFLEKTELLKYDRWYVEQTLFALAASLWRDVELLPAEYVMSLAKRCPELAVARHYVGAVRHLFYSEGISRVEPLLRRTALA